MGGAGLNSYAGNQARLDENTLLTVFTNEGGLSTPEEQTYVSRDCSYFKVDVEFQVVGQTYRSEKERINLPVNSQDIIRKISRPYLGYEVWD